MSSTTTAPAHAPVRAERQSPGYWRVTFDNPPLNLYEPEVETAAKPGRQRGSKR